MVFAILYCIAIPVIEICKYAIPGYIAILYDCMVLCRNTQYRYHVYRRVRLCKMLFLHATVQS